MSVNMLVTKCVSASHIKYFSLNNCIVSLHKKRNCTSVFCKFKVTSGGAGVSV